MIFGLFPRRNDNADIVDRLYGAIATPARDLAFYRDLGVPDTFEGRFDMLVITASLAMARLKDLPPPAQDLARDLADVIFREFDQALRESGVGDVGVPKKMKVLVSAFYGRAQAYLNALDGGSATLEDALWRNVFGRVADRREAADRLALWVRLSRDKLNSVDFDAFVQGLLPFPDPVIVTETPHAAQ